MLQHEFYIPSETKLGKLKIVDTFLYYDFPVFFTCVNENNLIFIAICIDEDEEGYKWLYSHVSDSTIINLKKGTIDFRDAVLDSINGVFFKVTIFFDRQALVENIDINDIDDDMLPVSGRRVENFESNVVPYYAESSIIARETERGVLNFIVEPCRGRHEAPVRNFGKLLTHLQNTFDSIGYKLSGFFKPFTNVPKMITNQTSLQLAMTFPGSLGVQLRSSCRADSPEFTLFELTAEKLYCILNSDKEKFLESLSDLDQNSIASISRLLMPIDEMASEIYFEYSLPKNDLKKHTKSSAELISNKIAIIKEIEFSESKTHVCGKIDGIMLSKRQFSIISSDGTNYTGEILDSALDIASIAKINSKCSALITSKIKHSKSSDKIIEKHCLEELHMIFEGDDHDSHSETI